MGIEMAQSVCVVSGNGASRKRRVEEEDASEV